MNQGWSEHTIGADSKKLVLVSEAQLIHMIVPVTTRSARFTMRPGAQRRSLCDPSARITAERAARLTARDLNWRNPV
jgi:hypothetical protein